VRDENEKSQKLVICIDSAVGMGNSPTHNRIFENSRVSHLSTEPEKEVRRVEEGQDYTTDSTNEPGSQDKGNEHKGTPETRPRELIGHEQDRISMREWRDESAEEGDNENEQGNKKGTEAEQDHARSGRTEELGGWETELAELDDWLPDDWSELESADVSDYRNACGSYMEEGENKNEQGKGKEKVKENENEDPANMWEWRNYCDLKDIKEEHSTDISWEKEKELSEGDGDEIIVETDLEEADDTIREIKGLIPRCSILFDNKPRPSAARSPTAFTIYVLKHQRATHLPSRVKGHNCAVCLVEAEDEKKATVEKSLPGVSVLLLPRDMAILTRLIKDIEHRPGPFVHFQCMKRNLFEEADYQFTRRSITRVENQWFIFGGSDDDGGFTADMFTLNCGTTNPRSVFLGLTHRPLRHFSDHPAAKNRTLAARQGWSQRSSVEWPDICVWGLKQSAGPIQ